MNQQHRTIAQILKERAPKAQRIFANAPYTRGFNAGAQAEWLGIVETFAERLHSDNPQCGVQEFMQACGVPPYSA